jgi:hypothetical protein
MKHKSFIVFGFLLSGFIMISMSFLIHSAVHENHLWRMSQNRLLQIKTESANIIFIGDSSLGEALDENYFSEISGIKTKNFSLTAGPHGFAASYNILRHIVERKSDVKLVVMVQTPWIWASSDFALGGYCSTVDGLDSHKPIELELLKSRFDCLYYEYANIGILKDEIKQRLMRGGIKTPEDRTYKNGKKNVLEEIRSGKFEKIRKLPPNKVKAIHMIDDYMADKKIKLLYIQGTLHRQIAEKYRSSIAKQQKILKELKHIVFIEKYLYPRNENMGNTENHVDISYKKGATRFYFEALKPYL